VMNGPGKSDSAIVAAKPTNKAGQPAAEPVERRAEAKGNASQQSTRRAQDRASVSQWGAWATLYPKCSICGIEFPFEARRSYSDCRYVALRTGSCAADVCEPRQIRNEAAVSRPLWVTQGSLA
jgi:predicted nucleic acid binding AN1-type Zn finger protein